MTEELKKCPFCGSIPEIIQIGNDNTIKRKITIKCKKCRIERTDASIKKDIEWLENFAIKNWNKRAYEND